MAPSNSSTSQCPKPIIIGIYGISGSGKTTLLENLKVELENASFSFYDGSDVLLAGCTGGIAESLSASEPEQERMCESAIARIQSGCRDSGRTGIVAGHYSFWSYTQNQALPACTRKDLEVYTHIIYLDTPAEKIYEQRQVDKMRVRQELSVLNVEEWKGYERKLLEEVCENNNILFVNISSKWPLTRVAELICDFRSHSVGQNLAIVQKLVDSSIQCNRTELRTMLVLDADKTLSPEDASSLFWVGSSTFPDKCNPLTNLFGGRLGYSHNAFRQAVLLYEQADNDNQFEARCEEVAAAIGLYPEIANLLRAALKEDHIGAFVVTCGLRRVWKKVLARAGLENVQVIGGGRIKDGYVITPGLKAEVVGRLKGHHNLHVWAFGDSSLDLEMLCRADEAIVVVGDEETRSKSMDIDLGYLIRDGTLRARQVLLPATVTPRLDTKMLPLVSLTDQTFIDSVVYLPNIDAGFEVHDATFRDGARILATSMQDATVNGPALRASHQRVGQYLAIEFLAPRIGVEEISVPHVQGGNTLGHCLVNESTTLIVALMRGGEPMAFGVNDIFPSASFLHAYNPEDIKDHFLKQYSIIILVDSVINKGTTIVNFEQSIRGKNPRMKIVVVAGVVQEGAIAKDGIIAGVKRRTKLDIVALRLSKNNYSIKGSTDTGNRLFNTTMLP